MLWWVFIKKFIERFLNQLILFKITFYFPLIRD